MRANAGLPGKVLPVTLLLLLAAGVLSCASLSRWKEKQSSDTVTALQGGGDTYCEMIVCIGEIKDECEMRIGVMKDYKAAIQMDRGESYYKDVERAVSVVFSRAWMMADSLSLNRLNGGDTLLFRKYRGDTIDYYARYHSNLLRMTRKIRLDEEAPGYICTYGDIFLAAESLCQKDKVLLGRETLVVKRRQFTKPPTDSFFISPIDHMNLY